MNPDNHRDFLFDKLTNHANITIITRMKRLILILCLIALGACAAKSDLVHDSGFPRSYPVY